MSSISILPNPKAYANANFNKVQVYALQDLQAPVASGNFLISDSAGNFTPQVGPGPGPFSAVGTTRQLLGSATGTNYLFSSASVVPYTPIDATNLNTSIVVPVGYRLVVEARVQGTTATGGSAVGILDTSTSTVLDAYSSSSASVLDFNLQGMIVGDGASHTISLQYALSGTGTNSIQIGNQPLTTSPTYSSFSASRPSVLVSLVQSN